MSNRRRLNGDPAPPAPLLLVTITGDPGNAEGQISVSSKYEPAQTVRLLRMIADRFAVANGVEE